jgi:amino acid transporter
MFMAYVVLLGFSTPNAIVLGEYALYAVDIPPNRWNVRAIAVATVSGLCYIYAKHPKLGLRLINVLGVAKMLILVIVILSGVAGGLMGVGVDRELLIGRRLDVPLSDVAPRSTAQRNFTDIWAGSSTQPYDYATALLKVIYCFRGYSTANQVLSDVKNPVRTLKIAAPIALTLVSVAYLAINIAFFLVVDKDDFRSAGVVVAGIFFRNVFGPGVGSHILPLSVIISAAGNIAATSFAQARVNEELAKDGLLPFTHFWTSATPTAATPAHDTKSHLPSSPVPPPSRGLLLHWLISTLVIVLPPPGRIYNFLVDIGGYPVSVISVAVSVGLLYLHATPSERWISPFRASRVAVGVFAASNCLLLILPWIPPKSRRGEDEGFPWFAYPATALGVLAVGAVWWVWWRFEGSGKRGEMCVLGTGRREWSARDGGERALLGIDEDEDAGEERGEGSIRVVNMGETVNLAVRK